jgi:phage terminase large subunit GpA-like protein
MLAVTEPGVRKISAMVATQLLKSTLLENIIGFRAHLDPGPMLCVQPKDDAADQFSKERIAPFVKATPVLRALIGTSKTRDSGDTIDYKAFPGGFLGIVGAGSPDNLARRPIRDLLLDEIDKYAPLKEGDPTKIAEERQGTFDNSLNVAVCSPTITGESKIHARFIQGDQRRASVACPDCGHRQFLEFFDHVHWTKGKNDKTHRPETARVYCDGCGVGWTEGQRLRALATIRWHQTRPFECCDELQKPLESYAAAANLGNDAVEVVWDWWAGPRHAVYRARCRHCGEWPINNEHASFHAGKLYSPWPNDAPPKIAGKWLEATDEDGKLVFYNTQLALPYRKNVGKELDGDTLLARREVWPAEVPDGVALLTAGIDVQDYRIEIEIVGWGRDEESWSIAYEVIDGEIVDKPIQDQLDKFLQRVWTRADGRPFTITAACIDSGGHHTNAVYDFSKARLGRFIWAIKGESARDGLRNPVWPIKRPRSRSKQTFRPVILGVNAAKDTIRTYLGKDKPGTGHMHFSVDRDVNYFQQLTAERIVVKERGGQKYRVWELIAGRANEALDCRVYAYAALHGLMHMSMKLNKRADDVGAAVTPDPDADPLLEHDHDEAAPAETPATIVEQSPVKITVGDPEAPPKKVSLGSMLARGGKS